ncbi:MAG TPA: hypothetical protein VH853_18720 [Polyangia bacterium]|jgi:hypothetical protein|nr:hypothetical protein [Polyangia bacterium]
MDQAPDSSTNAAQATALSNSWDAWDNYYKQASRRRRAMGGGGRQLREEKRRRRIRERLGLAISAALVGGLTLVFYLVLR